MCWNENAWVTILIKFAGAPMYASVSKVVRQRKDEDELLPLPERGKDPFGETGVENHDMFFGLTIENEEGPFFGLCRVT